MNQPNPNDPRLEVPVDHQGLNEARLIQFRVQVGYERLVVRGADRAAAVREARRQLCKQLPRMWDVIQALDDDKFEVTPDSGSQEP